MVRDLPHGRLRRVEEFLPVEERMEPALAGDEPDAARIALSPVFKTPAELEAGSPLFLDMVEDARILYDPEGFLAAYLERLRTRLRELALYGDIDFIPTEEYTAGDADRAYAEAAWVVELAGEVITRLPS